MGLRSCHDISSGGLGLALAEMAMASGLGCTVSVPGAPHVALFSEDQARYVVSAPGELAARLVEAAAQAGVELVDIGEVGGSELTVEGALSISVASLVEAHEDWFPTYMGAN